MSIGILYQDGLKEYDFGPGHPFRGRRAGEFIEFLKQHIAQNDNYRILKANAATEQDLINAIKSNLKDYWACFR